MIHNALAVTKAQLVRLETFTICSSHAWVHDHMPVPMAWACSSQPSSISP